MALLNLYLTSNQSLSKEQLVKVHPRWTHKQLIAIEVILANLKFYQDYKVLFESRNKANVLPKYNPLGVGHKAMLGAIEKLSEGNFIKLTKGIRRLQKDEETLPMLSEIQLKAKGLRLCLELNITAETVQRIAPEHHLYLKEPEEKGGRVIEYVEDEYSLATEKLMTEYNDFLRQHTIKCKGEVFDNPLIKRSYRNLDNSKLLKFGGRSGGLWHQIGKEERKFITINGVKTASCDYKSYVINILYLIETSQMLGRGVDGYAVEGIPREIVKVMVNRMLNNASQQGATLAFNKWLKTLANKDQRFFMKHRTIASVQKAILAHHPKIAHHFFKGKAHGQRIAWVEANAVFTVAQQLALMGVPVLTVHDEFICKKEDEELVWEVMYSTYVDYKNI